MKYLLECDNGYIAEEYVSALAKEGIKAQILDETATFDNGAASTCRIYVEKEKYELAETIVLQIKTERDNEKPWCPVCGSTNVQSKMVHHKHGPKWQLYLGVGAPLLCLMGYFVTDILLTPGWFFVCLLFFYFRSYDRKEYKCNDCDKVFNELNR